MVGFWVSSRTFSSKRNRFFFLPDTRVFPTFYYTATVNLIFRASSRGDYLRTNMVTSAGYAWSGSICIIFASTHFIYDTSPFGAFFFPANNPALCFWSLIALSRVRGLTIRSVGQRRLQRIYFPGLFHFPLKRSRSWIYRRCSSFVPKMLDDCAHLWICSRFKGKRT